MIPLALSGGLLMEIPAAAATPDGRGFPTPEAAAKALISAATRGDKAELMAVLGASAKEILSTSDHVADQRTRRMFVTRAAEKTKIVPDAHDPAARTLLVGKDEWPLPIPLVRVNGKWYFDVEEGKDEILSRRIGGNELDAIEVCRGFVEAESDYAEQNHTGSASRYAQKIISSPGMHDGLYWPSTGAADVSPMGDIVAKAFAEGYTKKSDPYRGYYFRVLTGQGPNAPGGEMSYFDNGEMTKGFALIAWPSDYGVTGVMTFLVDKSGIVYQKDLGDKTAGIAGGTTAYNPDETWTPVTDTQP